MNKSVVTKRCQANSAHTRQSRPDSGLGLGHFQAKVFQTFDVRRHGLITTRPPCIPLSPHTNTLSLSRSVSLPPSLSHTPHTHTHPHSLSLSLVSFSLGSGAAPGPFRAFAPPRRPFVGVSQVRFWSHWCAFVHFWQRGAPVP